MLLPVLTYEHRDKEWDSMDKTINGNIGNKCTLERIIQKNENRGEKT